MSVGVLGVCTRGVYWGCVLRGCMLGVYTGMYWLYIVEVCTGGVNWECVLGVYTGGVYRSCNQAENSWLPQIDLIIIDLNQVFH